MKNSMTSRVFILLIPAFLFSIIIYSQDCVVDKESLKGTYTGDCKKGKANGKGKAVGTDTYEGEFKSGLPDGEGIYTWSNGNVFSGKYSKGLRNGKGIMTFKKESGQDSIVEGFWKKDIYIGRYERPWIVHARTGSIRDVDIEFTPDAVRRIKFIITNTTGGAQTVTGATMPRYTIDNVQVLKGDYERLTSLETHLKSMESSLMEVIFPFRAKFNMGREEIEIEFLESGSYQVNIQINL